MKHTSFFAAFCMAATAVLPFAAEAADSFWDLKFNDHAPVPSNSWRPSPNGVIADQYTTASTLYFFNVAPDADVDFSVNLKVTATAYTSAGRRSNAYSYLGSFPNYRKAGSGEPNGDLGFLYQYNASSRSRDGASASNPAVGGIRYTFEFFQGDFGDRNTTTAFQNVYEVPSLRLLIYDVDSDNPGSRNPSVQVEAVRTYLDDGFYAYYVSKEKPLIVSEETVNGREAYKFMHNGSGDQSETDASGSTVLLFSQTSKITLELEARTISNSTNGVFGAIDADLSLIGGDLSNFDYVVVVPVPVPEPSSVILMGGAAAGMVVMALRRRRK